MESESRRKKGSKSPFAPIEDAIQAIRDGQMIIVVDDEDRENEGDLTIAAEKVTPEVINFMAKYGRGLICMPMTEERLAELDIPQMVSQNTAQFETAFGVSIEAKGVTSTGISAADRAATVLAAIDPKAAEAAQKSVPQSPEEMMKQLQEMEEKLKNMQAPAGEILKKLGLSPSGQPLAPAPSGSPEPAPASPAPSGGAAPAPSGGQ